MNKYLFFLLVFAQPAIGFARVDKSKPKITTFGQYSIVLTPKCVPVMTGMGQPAGYSTCSGGTAKLIGPGNLKLQLASDFDLDSFRAEIHGAKLYRTDMWKDITVQDLKAGSVPKTVFKKPTKCGTVLFINETPLIVCREAHRLSLLDPVKGTQKQIYPLEAREEPQDDGQYDDDYDLHGFSKINGKVWIYQGIASEPGLVDMCSYNLVKEKTHCYHIPSTNIDYFTIDLDREILVFSNFPSGNGELPDIEGMKESKTKINLWALNLATMKEIPLASAIAHNFNASWQDGILTYKMPNKKIETRTSEELASLIEKTGTKAVKH